MIRLQNIDSNIKPSRTFGRGKYLIGRSPSCDLEIPDRTMSRQHAMLEVVDDERIYLTDLDSRNGTKVNGERIMNTVRLKPDDIVSFGEVSFSVSPVDDDTFRGDTIPVVGEDDPNATVEFQVDTSKISIGPKKSSLVDALEFLGGVQVDPQDEERVVTDLLKGIRLAIDCDETSIHLIDRSSGKVAKSFGLGHGQIKALAGIPIAETVATSVIQSTPVVRVSGITGPTDEAGPMILAARIENDGDVLGLLCIQRASIENRDPGEVFGDIEDRTVSTVVNVVASKIANLQFLQNRR